MDVGLNSQRNQQSITMKKFTLILYFLHFTFFISNAQPGSLDNTFGTGGKVTTGFPGASDYCYSVALQSDGKIVTAGHTTTGTKDFAVIRYTPNGILDNTFGTDGKVTTDFGNISDEQGKAVVIQNDGKIVVAGEINNGGTNWTCGVVRYNTDGSPDNTFGSGGKVTTSVGTVGSHAFAVALQVDGKIVIGGYSYDGTHYDFIVVRYNSDGSLDNTFDSDGKVSTDFGNSDDYGLSIAIQSDGKIVLAGNTVLTSDFNFALARYNSDGSLDNTFGSGGKVITDFGGPNDMGYSVQIQADGKIVVAGESYTGSNIDFALARYNNNGTLDNTFDSDGKVTTSIGSGDDWGFAVAIQADNKILVTGRSDNGLNYDDFAIVRYNTNGTLDNTFDSDGIVTTAIGNSSDFGNAIVIQTDEKIVVAGVTFNGGDFDIAVARYNNTVLTGVTESRNKNELQVEIYPNPSSGIFTFNLKNKTVKTEICIHDVLGKCVFNKLSAKNSNEEIDLSCQPKGIYFMEIVSDGERAMKKIVLQ